LSHGIPCMSFPAATSATDTSGSMFSCGTYTEEEEEKNQNFPQQETKPTTPDRNPRDNQVSIRSGW
jgi:hypothetical protein